jgi:hypothetical protein
VIEKLLARFGYFRGELVDQAYRDGREDGQRDTMLRAESMVACERAENEMLKREREHIHKVLAEHVALNYKPPPIVIAGNSL